MSCNAWSFVACSSRRLNGVRKMSLRTLLRRRARIDGIAAAHAIKIDDILKVEGREITDRQPVFSERNQVCPSA